MAVWFSHTSTDPAIGQLASLLSGINKKTLKRRGKRLCINLFMDYFIETNIVKIESIDEFYIKEFHGLIN